MSWSTFEAPREGGALFARRQVALARSGTGRPASRSNAPERGKGGALLLDDDRVDHAAARQCPAKGWWERRPFAKVRARSDGHGRQPDVGTVHQGAALGLLFAERVGRELPLSCDLGLGLCAKIAFSLAATDTSMPPHLYLSL